MQRIQTRVRLAEVYKMDRETITRMLIRIGITHSYALSPIEVEMFLNKYGDPKKLKKMAEKFAD